MYETEFADHDTWAFLELPLVPGDDPPRFDASNVARALSLRWEEHCVECATPECFETCPLHRPRVDGACARFAYGIVANPAFAGLLPWGADLRFGRWAKLEAHFADGVAVDGPFPVADQTAGVRTTNPAEVTEAIATSDELVLECFSAEGAACRLIVEYFVLNKAGRESRFRRALEVSPGHTLHRIPVAELHIDREELNGFMHVAPAADLEAGRGPRVVFTWLDFVRYRRADEPAGAGAPGGLSATPADAVKCVAWDLDGTLWDGVLIDVEDGGDIGASVRPEVVEVMRALDARGVLQTVVSKNDYEQAWPVLERLGVAELVLHPAINWGPKSDNLRAVARRLNIGLDTFALVDDSPFERGEVAGALPQVRVYDAAEVKTLLGRPELDLPVTTASRGRRQSYVDERARESVRAGFSGDYQTFLASCRLTMRLFRPSGEAAVLRCWELLQRSNQLNLSGERPDRATFDALLTSDGIVPVAFECADRYGDYGVVGYATLDERTDSPVLRDLVISCRVAQKRVEYAFLQWAFAREQARGCGELRADLTLNGKNVLMTKAIHASGFGISKTDGRRMWMRRRLSARDATPSGEPVAVTTDPSLRL